MPFHSRIATHDDIQSITRLMSLSMGKLLKHVLNPEQVAKSHASMGLDTQLLDDQAYFLIFDESVLVGCVGVVPQAHALWRRSYGGAE